MFDMTPEDYWMGPPRPKNKKKRKGTRRRSPASAKRPISYKNTLKGAKATYKGAKATYQYATKGYVGSAEEAYKKREAKFKKASRELEFKKKLKSEYGVKTTKSKLRGLFKRKKKSIYR